MTKRTAAGPHRNRWMALHGRPCLAQRARAVGRNSRRLLLCALLPALACAGPRVMTERGPQAYYQTGFPSYDTSADLERVLRSMKRVHVTGYYSTYRFALSDSVTHAAVRSGAALGRATEQLSSDHTRTGTATIIARDGGRFTLITCEHVTRLPDTVIVYHGAAPERGRAASPSPFVESVSIRTGSRRVVAGIADGPEFSILERDSTRDVALITVQVPDPADWQDAPVARLTLGNAARLSWGSFVYVLGFPRGFQMVTRGIVSDPNRDRDHSFLLDGLFNRGISGGLILAVRGDTGALEWVGLASGAAATTEYMLMPEPRLLIDDAGMVFPYEGRLYLESVARIDYGVTFSVSSTTIRQLLAAAGIAAR